MIQFELTYAFKIVKCIAGNKLAMVMIGFSFPSSGPFILQNFFHAYDAL